VHNGIAIEPRPTASDRRRARLLLGVEDDAFVAITVGRLDPVKDFASLLDAFAHVRRSGLNARLVVVGDGPERERLAARAAGEDLAGAVTFAGYRSDVRLLLPGADLYVNSSISEGISITVLEAMAAGLPVVATAVGGTPEIVDGTTGVLVPGRSPERLASAITALAHDDYRRAALGNAGRRRVEQQFTIDRMVGQYASAYRRLLG
jgi:L-malate glycosyltransferase